MRLDKKKKEVLQIMSKDTRIILIYYCHERLELIHDPQWSSSILKAEISRRPYWNGCLVQMGETVNASTD
jgi:hypothetical protein